MYVGRCRCGLGPNAFYQDPQGRMVHASQLFQAQTTPAKTGEEFVDAKIEAIREKLDELAAEISELSGKIKGTTSQQPFRWWQFKKQGR